jgi:hypothetical protein
MQLQTSYTPKESTQLCCPRLQDTVPSTGIAALTRARMDTAHKTNCLATGITPRPPNRRSPGGTKGKVEAWARLLMKKKCGKRADSRPPRSWPATAEEKTHGRSATINGKGNTSPSAQAQGRRPRQRAAGRRSEYPREYARPARPEHRHHHTSHTIARHLHVKLTHNPS